jgi:hypothetical protein
LGCEGRVGGCGAGALVEKSAAHSMCLMPALPVPRIRDGGSGLHTHRTSADCGTWRPRRGSNGRRAGGAGGAGAHSWCLLCLLGVHAARSPRLCPSLCPLRAAYYETCTAQVPFMPHRPPPHTHTPRATHTHAPHTTHHTPRTTRQWLNAHNRHSARCRLFCAPTPARSLSSQSTAPRRMTW